MTPCAMPHTGRMLNAELKRAPRSRSSPRIEAILDRGWELVSSVPYKVSLRWLFYKLLQEGHYKTKDDYKNKFCWTFSRARHSYHKNWRPDTLTDEGRNVITRVSGYESTAQAGDDLRENILGAANISIDHFYRQENYVELWFEANAMVSQFQYYTKNIDLIPMGGTASIPYKWSIAKRLEDAGRRYGKPIKILYFGDEDYAGHEIQGVIESDVGGWCSEPFEVIWCGLTMEQAEHYGIPENFEKKGYQWEALPDEGAKEIITSAIERHIDLDLINEAEEDAEAFAENWKTKLESALDGLEDES